VSPSSPKEEPVLALLLQHQSSGQRGRDPNGEKQRKVPVLVGGQPRHRHNHQHQKGLWKRQILPRPAQAALQL
jgi:hypothetical protein